MDGMSINLTLVVQIGNFFIAYMLITRFFLRPGYKVVKSDHERVRQIKSQIVARQELISHKQEYKRSRWELFQDYFFKQKPDIPEEMKVAHPRQEGIVAPKLTEKELTGLSSEIVERIKDRL